jgi:hypothetical protein
MAEQTQLFYKRMYLYVYTAVKLLEGDSSCGSLEPNSSFLFNSVGCLISIELFSFL